MARSLSTRGRFAVAYLVLGAAVGAALGALIVLVERPGPQPPPPWSAWQPQASSETLRLQQIADHVGNEYTLPSGDPLTSIRIGGPATGKNLKAILIPTKPKPTTLADFDRFDESKSAIFLLYSKGAIELWRGRGRFARPRRRLGSLLLAFGSLYVAVMVIR